LVAFDIGCNVNVFISHLNTVSSAIIMVEETPTSLNIFISRTNNDEEQQVIYEALSAKYDGHDAIRIIDVDEKHAGVGEKLCDGILREIQKCDVFISILTPSNANGREIHINSNVLFELGYAYSCIDKENIYVFVKEDEYHKKNFEMLRPSMLSSIKYNTYMSYEDIDNIIKMKLEEFEYNHANNHTEYAMLDEKVVSLIKYEMVHMLNNTDNIEDILCKLRHYVDTYKHNEVTEITFLFIANHITDHQLSHSVLNWFFYFVTNNMLDSWYKHTWIQNQNNQIKLLNLLRMIQYQLFEKFKYLNKKPVKINRRNFAITIFELLKVKIIAYKSELQTLLNKSVKNDVHKKYEIYVCKLKSLHSSKNTNEKNHYQDLILFSKNSYNKWNVSTD